MSATRKKLDATIKDCAALMKAGFLQMAPDPADRPTDALHTESLGALTKTTTGWELDFGCCLLRV